MLQNYTADLHIHTCLSPCGELEMSPVNIVDRAHNVGLDIIAICDHNSAENTEAVIDAAANTDLAVIPGMEITSSEEVHILGLFPNLESAKEAQKTVYRNLHGKNDESFFGQQVVANGRDEVIGFNDKLLIGPTTMTVSEVVSLIHENDGIAVAAHVDRESYSITGKLGFIPDDLDIDAAELSVKAERGITVKTFPSNIELPVIRSSDAHQLDQVGAVHTNFYIAQTTLDEINLAFDEFGGRRIITDE